MVNIYGICQSIGFVIVYNVFKYNFLELFPNLNTNDLGVIVITLILSAIIGARIMSYAQNDIRFNTIHRIQDGGMSTFGTYYAAVIVACTISFIYKLDTIKFCECVMLSGTFHSGMVRFGNYFKGELPGKYSNVLGRRHPSQLYQLIGEGIIMSSILWYFRYTLGQGIIFMITPSVYCVVRFICEIFKEEEGGIPKWFTKSLHKYIRWAQFQAICLPIVFGVIFLFIKN